MKKFLGVLLTLCICLSICAPVLDGIEASAVSANNGRTLQRRGSP